jgi:hypothetical protein
MIEFLSFSIYIISLIAASYAVYRGGKPGPRGERGEKGDVGDTGARGLRGESSVVSKPIESVRIAATPRVDDTRPKFLSKEDRREQIAAQADDPEYQDGLEEIRIRLRDGSGLIGQDSAAQNNQPDWRRRNAR